MDLPDFPAESILFLGIDDFSFLRGRRFGTILVNLETRHVVDLLPDRKAETAAAWMRAHPEIELVSRDRGGDYAAVRIVDTVRRFGREVSPQLVLDRKTVAL